MGNLPEHAYDQQASGYADFADNSYSWLYVERPAFDTALANIPTETTRAVDIGCGSGRIIRYLLSLGLNLDNIVGIDPSKEILREARQRLPGARLLQAQAQELPLPDSHFDLATANMVTHTMDQEGIADTLYETHRVLNRGGLFFFVDAVPDQQNPGTWSSHQTPWGTTVDFFNYSLDWLHKEAEQIGFRQIEVTSRLPVVDAAKTDPGNFEKYSTSSFRVSVAMQKA